MAAIGHLGPQRNLSGSRRKLAGGANRSFSQQGASGGSALKVFAVLEYIAAAQRPLAISELAVLLGVPKPTMHRIVRQLDGEGLLQREPDSRVYGPGPRLLNFALGAIRSSMRSAPRHAVLEALSAKVGETCNFGMISGGVVLYIDRVEASWPFGLRFEPGSRVPLHCTSVGKLLLSVQPRRRRDELMRARPLARYTDFWLSDKALIRPATTKFLNRQGMDVTGNYNGLVEQMEGDWLWIMGDDHTFAPDILVNLLAHEVDVVVPLVLKKDAPFDPVVYEGEEGSDEATGLPFHRVARLPQSGLHEIYAAGSAGMLIRRHVLDALERPVFETSHGVQNEDLLFCRKVREAGFSIWCDVDQPRTYWGVVVAYQAPSAFQEMPHAVHGRGLPWLRHLERPHEHLVKPQRVGAVCRNDVVGIDDVEARLRHLIDLLGYRHVAGEMAPLALNHFLRLVVSAGGVAIGEGQDHPLIEQLPERLLRRDDADVVEHLVPEARIQEVEHRMLRAADIEIDWHPIPLLHGINQRPVVVRIDLLGYRHVAGEMVPLALPLAAEGTKGWNRAHLAHCCPPPLGSPISSDRRHSSLVAGTTLHAPGPTLD